MYLYYINMYLSLSSYFDVKIIESEENFKELRNIKCFQFESIHFPWSSNQSPHDKTNKMACAPSEDSDPHSLFRVFAVHVKKVWVLSSHLSYQVSAQWRLWSDWAEAQAELSLRWTQNVILFVLSWGGSFDLVVDKSWYSPEHVK